MENVAILVMQVAILFLLIGVGYLAVKFKLIGETGAADLNKVLLYIVLPSVILNLLNTPFEAKQTKNLLIATALSIVAHLLGMVISKIAFRHSAKDQAAIARSAVILSNCAFMAIPLVRAVAGDIATLYLVAYLVVFNIVTWTVGVKIMFKNDERLSIKQVLMTPTLIAVAIGLILYVTNTAIPRPLSDVVSYLANTNSPLAMIVIGAQIALTKPRLWPQKIVWQTILLRNLVVPLLMLPLILFVTRDQTLIFAIVIAAGAPTAANVVMFATRYDGDIRLAAETLAHSTLWSILTLTGLVWVTDTLLSKLI